MDEIVQQKPRLIILNKSDLADQRETQKWIAYFKSLGHEAVSLNSQTGHGVKQIVPLSLNVLAEKRAREAARGIKPRAIRALVLGIPNVGKSTLMNRLARRNVAKTGNKPGVTKGQQWVKVGNELELLDTPGILWPKFEDEAIGKKLALTGAIKDTLLHLDDLALYGIEFFNTYYPEALPKRFHYNDAERELSTVDQLLLVTKKRGYQDDYDRGSEMLIQEIRSGQLGPYTLDRYGVKEEADDHE